MTTKEIKDLLNLISGLDLKEVRIKDKDFEIRIRTDKDLPSPMVSSTPVIPHPQPMPVSAPVTPEPESSAKEESQEEVATESANQYIEVKSPMVGTFYRSPSPDKPVYVQVGDTVSKGDVVCIIEAMKLFNEIESEVSGKVVKILVDDSSPVEYDQALFLLDPGS